MDSLEVVEGTSKQWRLWSDCIDAQADLSLCWSPMSYCRFVMHWLIIFCLYFHKYKCCEYSLEAPWWGTSKWVTTKYVWSNKKLEQCFQRKTYEGCSKWIAYFYLETSNFKLAQKYSFHALEVLPVARNAKFQPMYPLLEGVTVRRFGHSNKVLMNGWSKCLSGLVFPPSKECFQFRKQKEITWGKVWGIRGVRQNSYFSFLQKRRNYCGGMSWGIVM